MIEIAAKYLENVAGARSWNDCGDRVCTGVVIDSRKVENGSIFVAFPGENVDGNDYASSAVDAGAGCVVMTREPDGELLSLATEHGCHIVTCDDPTRYLLDLAHEYRRGFEGVVVGVTGSIGKTTTKDVLKGLLSKRYRVHATVGNYNNLIGLPLTILSAPADTEVMILEMGMDGLGQIEQLSRCAEPSFAIITKVGTSHIGLLGSRENIARAKAEICFGMVCAPDSFGGKAPVLALCGEDEFTPFIVDNFAAPAGIETILCGFSDSDSVRADGVSIGEDGRPSFALTLENGEAIETALSIPGKQSVVNALYAAAIASRLGIMPEQIDEAFGELEITARRQDVRVTTSGARIIDDSYNASPESMAAGLDLLVSLPCDGARVAILGEMGELGGEAPRLHGLVGAYAAAKKLSLLVCVGGENAHAMAASARMMGMDEDSVMVVPACDDLVARFPDMLSAGDLALVKGSRFVGLDRYVEEVC